MVQLIQDIEAKLAQAVTDLTQTPSDATDALALLQAAQPELAQAIADVQALIAQPPPPPPLPPPPPPTTLGAEWSWDATKAIVYPNSASLVAAFLQYKGGGPYFFIEPATADVLPGTAVYAVDTSKVRDKLGNIVGWLDNPVYVPVGTRTGVSTDGHVMIADHVRGRWHDFWHALFDASGKLYTWKAGSSMPINKTNPPYVERKTGEFHTGATAADFPLARGIVTPEEVKAGVIPHALCMVAANLGPAPNPYPANPATSGYTTGNYGSWSGGSVVGHLPLGTWLRMNPAATLPATATPFERVIFACLKQYGVFIRDRGPSMTLHGADRGGGGASFPAWHGAGVAVDGGGVLGIQHAIPWAQLQVLNPPTT